MRVYQECMDCRCDVDDPVVVDTGLCPNCFGLKKMKINVGIVILAGVGLAALGMSSFQDGIKVILAISMMLSAGIVYHNSQDN